MFYGHVSPSSKAVPCWPLIGKVDGTTADGIGLTRFIAARLHWMVPNGYSRDES
jgi:hypothetical protein